MTKSYDFNVNQTQGWKSDHGKFIKQISPWLTKAADSSLEKARAFIYDTRHVVRHCYELTRWTWNRKFHSESQVVFKAILLLCLTSRGFMAQLEIVANQMNFSTNSHLLTNQSLTQISFACCYFCDQQMLAWPRNETEREKTTGEFSKPINKIDFNNQHHRRRLRKTAMNCTAFGSFDWYVNENSKNGLFQWRRSLLFTNFTTNGKQTE